MRLKTKAELEAEEVAKIRSKKRQWDTSKLAIIYIRQSTEVQTRRNRESRGGQSVDLVDMAIGEYQWPEMNIYPIDENLLDRERGEYTGGAIATGFMLDEERRHFVPLSEWRDVVRWLTHRFRELDADLAALNGEEIQREKREVRFAQEGTKREGLLSGLRTNGKPVAIVDAALEQRLEEKLRQLNIHAEIAQELGGSPEHGAQAVLNHVEKLRNILQHWEICAGVLQTC
jgi:hypothetical protein